jgi:hypothetical protein
MQTQGSEMKELPEPFRRQGQQIASDGDDKVFCDLWERGQVLAIQKQAYEDGLRDAIMRISESTADVDDMFAKIHASPSFELESVRKSFAAAMLTASQKENK